MAEADTQRILSPQPGPQTKLAACKADIAIFGGQAGGGKSFSILLENMRWCERDGFAGVIFRRDGTDLVGAGSIWEEARKLFPLLGGHMREGAQMDCKWPSGAHVMFRGLQHESDVLDYQGYQFSLACFDELTHFTEKQFWYIWSRMRNTCGINAYMRATCNPDPDSWVRTFIDWWIDKDTGLPIPERDGVLRWFARQGDDLIWFDTADECQLFLSEIGDSDQEPHSVTFIRSTLADNKLGDPNYRGKLAGMDAVNRAQLLDGNWNARAKGGAYFSRMWFDVLDVAPKLDRSQVLAAVRAWDLAASRPTPKDPDPDWTVGVLMYLMRSGLVIVVDVVRVRESEGGVDMLMAATCRVDGSQVVQALWQDPAAAGKRDVAHIERNLRKALPTCRVIVEVARENKETYAKPFSARCDPRTLHNQPRAAIVRADWNQAYLGELEAFPNKTAKKDQVDASSRAWLELENHTAGFFHTDFLAAMQNAR